ncbi:hypothetical protein ABEB36_007854 [Hypothenemus hampei]|uniref:Uncharacterized protein n=1 Tax=Hypothenemus hampei TaxID=57062 RepID=A0ABD1EXU1_HYPHA
MEECLNVNWSIDIPHLNITYQKNTLKELQWKLDNTRSEIQENKNTKKLVTFLIYWSIAASLRAGDSGTGNNLDNARMDILWLCTAMLAAILFYYCIHSVGKRVVQWCRKYTHHQNQPSSENTEIVALEPPVTQNDNPGFITGSTTTCLNCSTNANGD